MAQSSFSQLSVIQERISSLLDDGYLIKFISTGQYSLFWKLVHCSNGNVITLTADVRKGRLIQKTNGKVVHDSIL